MNKTLTALCLIGIALSSCDKTNSTPEDASGTEKTNAGVTSQDTSNAVSIPIAEQAELLDIRYAVKPGDVFHYKMSAVSSMEEDTLRLETRTTQFYTKKVKSVRSDGSIELTLRYDSMMVASSMKNLKNPAQMRERKFNSTNPEDKKNPEFANYMVLIGEDVTMLVSPKGVIEEISGFTPIYNKIVGDKKDSVPADQRDMIIERLKAEMYAIPLQQEFITYPDSIPDSTRSWSKTFSIPLAGTFAANSTIIYTVRDIKKIRDRNVIEIGSRVNSVVTNPKVENQQLSAKLNSNKVTGSGRILLDAQKGYTILKNQNLTQFIDATLTDKQSKQEMRRVQKQSSSVAIELLR